MASGKLAHPLRENIAEMIVMAQMVQEGAPLQLVLMVRRPRELEKAVGEEVG